MRRLNPALLERLAAEQDEAARVGHATWGRYVDRAVRETGTEWWELRQILDPYCRAFYERRDRQHKQAATGEAPAPTEGTVI